MRIYLPISIVLLLLSSCTSKSGFTGGTASNNSNSDKETLVSEDADASAPALTKEELLCQKGPEITTSVGKSDFSKLFSSICANGTVNDTYKNLLSSAYKGEGEPSVEILESTVDELLTTNLTLAFAVNIPLSDPSRFADYKVHNIFAGGVEKENSKMIIEVEKREEFPGRKSIEAISLKYDIKSAKGAGIYDIRTTEFNTYLLQENNREIVLSTEHLTDAESNSYYHLTDGLTIASKTEDGRSNVVFISNLVIKGRIDPSRIQEALTRLNEQVAVMTFDHVAASPL